MITFAAATSSPPPSTRSRATQSHSAMQPNRSFTGAPARHHDTTALQAAIDKAAREKRNVYSLPATTASPAASASAPPTSPSRARGPAT